MKLDPEQQGMLNGEHGQAMSLAARTLVEYGKAFGAQRLVPIKSAHLVGSFGALPYKAYYKILDQCINAGLKVKVLTTINPRPGHDLNLLNRIAFFRQSYLEHKISQLGVTLNYSCVCYDSDNVPSFGDRIAWAESSAVQFANSVLGARTNRNSMLVDLCSAITGLTPEFGYLLDENRRGKVMVQLKIKTMDPTALGFIIGKKVVNKVPVIEHYDFSRSDLKNMGAAMAASGGIALFHVEGLTPEAPDIQSAFGGGKAEQTITITQDDLKSIQTKQPDNAELVIFGCPHLTYEEAVDLAGHFAGKRLKKSVWFCMTPEAKARFEKTVPYKNINIIGIKVFSHCPQSSLAIQLRRKKVLTPCAKLFYYLKGAEYASVSDCTNISRGV
jgi:cis-L-3-hydroxyproline dehydratase